ncbi:uncharacterized protein LOC131939177 [Physella acuta]|uniref:uncharacterized protein LOC131939177 n=1 Tax=Physella acuta TaxID=109671 RepID=UPI0027DB85D0|nr:uncharacterized protein LOC131939177 [Physella acuta]
MLFCTSFHIMTADARQTILLLKERLIFLLYCLNKPVYETEQEPCSMYKDLEVLFRDLLLQPKLDLVPQTDSPSVDLHKSIVKFSESYISFENYVHVMCNFLGIVPKVRDRFKALDDLFKYHFSYKVWIGKFLENKHLKFLKTFNEHQDLALSLSKIGYTEERSKYIGGLVHEDLCHLHSPLFWALRYLHYSFYYDSLLLCVPKFLFQSDKINEWFDQYCDHDDDDNSCKMVKMINLTTVDSEKEKVLPLLLDSDDYVHLYHGTTYESCIDLIRNGIILGSGSAKQDFSSWKGFYLSEDLEDAKRWGSAGRGDSYAVLVYKVRRDFVDAEKQHGLDLTEYDQWNSVVKYFRSGCEIELYPSVPLENVSFIRGPTATGQAFLDSHLGRDFNMGDSIQICIRDQTFAEKFGDIENVFCVLFY